MNVYILDIGKKTNTEKEIKKITEHFDKSVDKIKQKRFDVKNPPERHICKDCDFKHFCTNQGIIDYSEEA